MTAEDTQLDAHELEGAVLPVSVIDIGATSIRMLIAQMGSDGELHTLESLQQPVSLGTDTFTRGDIRQETVEECVVALKKFKQVLEEYRITSSEQLRVVATSAVREAGNRHLFLDRVKIATDFNVEVIDEAEANRFTYLSTQPLFANRPELENVRTLIIEVGGGSTDLLAVRNEAVLFSQAFRLGSLRLRETLETFRAPLPRQREVIELHIGQTVEQITERVEEWDDLRVLGIGGDLRLAADRMLEDSDSLRLRRLPIPKLAEFTEEILSHSVEELVNAYHITFPEAETLGPALLSYLRLAQNLKLKEVLVSSVSMRDGVLKEVTSENTWTGRLADQILHSAINLGKKYNFDQPHSEHVADLAVALYRELQPEHQLSPRHELILYVAALLHEIGLFVSNRSHHKHSMYLIKNSALFGIGRYGQLLTALVARYHRKALPNPRHEDFNQLDQQSRIIVMKLAAILRVADALDRGHTQRVRNIQIAKEQGRVTVLVPNIADLTFEQIAVHGKGDLFQQVYGMDVTCRIVPHEGRVHDAGT